MNGRRGLLGKLLVAALYGAVPFRKVACPTVTVPHDLYLDMARLLDQLFHVHGIIAKGSLSLLDGQIPRLFAMSSGFSRRRACPCRHRPLWP